MAKQDYSFIGKGRVFARLRGGTKQFEIGNCSALSMSATEEKKTLKNYKAAGGGLANSLSRIDTVGFNLTMHDLDQDNLALLALGTSADVASGSAVSESHTAYVGGLVRLNFIDPSSVAVTGPSGTPSYTAGTDYEVTEAGIVPLQGGGITDGATVEVSYSYSAAKVMEALTDSGQEWELTFSGLNEARSGKAVVVDIWRAKPGPFSEMPLIGDEFAAPQISGELLEDASKTGAGISKYFKYSYVD